MSLGALIGLALGTAAMTVVLCIRRQKIWFESVEDANAPLRISLLRGPFWNWPLKT